MQQTGHMYSQYKEVTGGLHFTNTETNNVIYRDNIYPLHSIPVAKFCTAGQFAKFHSLC